jgi:asparagine synthase (glutamine-hydrolysing)
VCGIAGYVGPDPQGDAPRRVRDLLAAQAHRGPDGSGLLRHGDGDSSYCQFGDEEPRPLPACRVTGPRRTAVVLGSCRLAIMDRSAAGRQPMTTPDGRFGIVFNGEIYNYRELGRELEGRGHRFRSRSDTEVLLAAFAEWGSDCLARLIGMFAFVVLDRHEARLFLARDPFGIKPLNFARVDGGLALASEMSPLLGWPGVSRRVAPQPLCDYLEHGVIDGGERTLFADVHSLPPAHCAEIALDRPDSLRSTRYWQPDEAAELDLDPEAAARRLRELLLESVSLHIRSDVPVGVLLSGGIDSASVAMAMRHVGGDALEIHSFSYVAGHGAPSEEPWIDVANAACGAVPHKLSLEPGDWTADIDSLVASQDEPFGSIAIHAQSRLFRSAREAGVPVVLSGTGSDEMLMGYEWYWPAQALELLRRGSPRGALRLLRGIAGSRGVARSLRTAVSTALLALPPGVRSTVDRMRGAPTWIDPGWGRRTARREWPVCGPRVLADRIWHRLSVGLPDLLRYEDRGGMAHAVEARVPFLTRELAEFALALPPNRLMGEGGETKQLLRRAMRGIVPDAILERREMAFSVPLASWPNLVPGFGALLEALAAVPAVDVDGLRPAIRAIARGERVPPSLVYPVWRLVGLSAWAAHFGAEFD